MRRKRSEDVRAIAEVTAMDEGADGADARHGSTAAKQQREGERVAVPDEGEGDLRLDLSVVDIPDSVRLAIGRAVQTAGEHWRESLHLCDVFARHFHGFVIDAYLPSSLVVPYVEKSGLVGCWKWKPLLNGREVMQLAGLRGREVGAVVQHVMEQMLINPAVTRDEMEAWLLRWKGSRDANSESQQQRL